MIIGALRALHLPYLQEHNVLNFCHPQASFACEIRKRFSGYNHA